MASYREKTNQKKLSTESGKIAWAINWIETHPDLKYDVMTADEETELYDGVSIWHSHDCSVWVVAKVVPYKANRYWAKYVQSGLFWEEAKTMLDAQPWLYI